MKTLQIQCRKRARLLIRLSEGRVTNIRFIPLYDGFVEQRWRPWNILELELGKAKGKVLGYKELGDIKRYHIKCKSLQVSLIW